MALYVTVLSHVTAMLEAHGNDTKPISGLAKTTNADTSRTLAAQNTSDPMTPALAGPSYTRTVVYTAGHDPPDTSPLTTTN